MLNLQNLNHWLHCFTIFLWTMECRIWNLKYWPHFAIKLCGNTLNTVYILHFFLHKLCDTTQNLKHYILLSFSPNSVTHNIAPKTFWPQAIDCVFVTNTMTQSKGPEARYMLHFSTAHVEYWTYKILTTGYIVLLSSYRSWDAVYGT